MKTPEALDSRKRRIIMRLMKRHRLYVDESGDHTYNEIERVNKRYLGLTGIVVKTTDYRDCFHPSLERLKQNIFPHSPDDPVILVRNRIVRKKGIFRCLLDPQVNARWEEGLLDFFREHLMRVFTVVLDKKAHRERYALAAFHPYQYCFTVLLERYRGWLAFVGGRGDVMAESRGGEEDVELKMVYRDYLEHGSYYLSAQQMQDVLTSKEVKLKRKDQNIAGLQIADLLAYPARVDILVRNNRMPTQSRFTKEINDVLNTKYNQYGRTFLG